jgi:hypothetical protein
MKTKSSERSDFDHKPLIESVSVYFFILLPLLPNMSDLNNQSLDIPEEFCCPITNELMREPVLSKFGHSYERSAICEWLTSHSNCPLTRNTMKLSDLITNQNLRTAIRLWQLEHGFEVVSDRSMEAADIIVGYVELKSLDETDRTEGSDSEDGQDAGNVAPSRESRGRIYQLLVWYRQKAASSRRQRRHRTSRIDSP